MRGRKRQLPPGKYAIHARERMTGLTLTDVEVRVDDYVRCLICLQYGNSSQSRGEWIQYKSLRTHLSSTAHQQSLLAQEDAKERDKQVERQMGENEARAAAAEPHRVPTSSLQILNSPTPNAIPSESDSEAKFWEAFDMDTNPNVGTLGESIDEFRARLEARLDAQLQQWTNWGGGNEIAGDDTVPGNVRIGDCPVLEMDDISLALRELFGSYR